MSVAVGVLILGDPPEIEASMRATLEHVPALQTMSEGDILATDGGGCVALVFVRDAKAEAAQARIASLRAGRPGLRVLALFGALGAEDARALLDAGANALMARGASAAEICAVVQALAAGLAVPPPCPALADPSANRDVPSLTQREAEVLRFLSAGFSNKEVARRLSLSVRTVETHRLNLRRKTQTGRLKDLVSLARQLGLAPVLDGEGPRRLLAADARSAHH